MRGSTFDLIQHPGLIVHQGKGTCEIFKCVYCIYIQLKLYTCAFRLIINFTKNLVISWDFHTFGELPTSGFREKIAILYQPLNNFLCYLGGAGVWLSECILFDGNNICISNKTQAVSEPSPNQNVFFLFLPSLLNCWQSLQINLPGEIENSPVLGVLSVLKLLHVFFSKTSPILKVFIQHAREAWELKDSSVNRARAFNNWQGHAVGRGKDFQKKKNGLPRQKGSYSETKRDIVVGPTGKIGVTHRAKMAKIGLPGFIFYPF